MPGSQERNWASRVGIKAIQISDLCYERIKAEVLAADLATGQAAGYDLGALATAAKAPIEE